MDNILEMIVDLLLILFVLFILIVEADDRIAIVKIGDIRIIGLIGLGVTVTRVLGRYGAN